MFVKKTIYKSFVTFIRAWATPIRICFPFLLIFLDDSTSRPILTTVVVLSSFLLIAIACMSFLIWKMLPYFQDARDNTKAEKSGIEEYEGHGVASIPTERGETSYFELYPRAPQGQDATDRHYQGLQHNAFPDYQNMNDERIRGVYEGIGKVRKI